MSGDILLPANVPQSEVNSAFGEDYFQLWFGRMIVCVCGIDQLQIYNTLRIHNNRGAHRLFLDNMAVYCTDL